MINFLKKKKYKISINSNLLMLEKLFSDYQSGESSAIDYDYWLVNLEELKEGIKYFPQYEKDYKMYSEVFELFKKDYDLH